MLYQRSMCHEDELAQMSGIWIDKRKAHFKLAFPELDSCGSVVTRSHRTISFPRGFHIPEAGRAGKSVPLEALAA